jgi:HlyD family secretion protein
MSETLNEYPDLLDGAEHRWRNRLIGLAVLGALLAGGAYVLWAMVLGGGGSSAAEIQTATVQRGSISQTFSTTGSVVAQSTANLSFGQSAVVSAVNVTLGQEVKQGDVLAEIEPDELESALTTAELNLASAQAKLDDLLAGSTKSELASADQSLAQAQANLDKANRALQDLKDGPSDTELLSAELAVTSAQSQLAKAEESRSNLYSASDDAVAAAEDAVSKAEDALADAKRTAANAADSLTSAKVSLQSAGTTYCDIDDHLPVICNDFRIPLPDAKVSTLTNSIGPNADPEPSQDLIKATTSLISANTSYKNAVASKTSADDAIEPAEADIEAAQNDLEEAKKGPSSADIAAADNAVASAQLSLDEAKAKLAELKQGSTQDDLDDAQSSVNTASIALEAAKAKRDEVYAGATPEDIDLQRGQVQQAELSVKKARKDLDKARIIAPFDGTVAELNIAVGDLVAASSATSAIVLSTPDTVYLNLTITESDITGLKVDQSGTASFDALEGSAFPIVIDSVGTNPATTQGVVTYQARARILIGLPSGAAGALPSGAARRSALAAGTPTPEATPSAGASGSAGGADTSAKPLPGMNASVTIIVDQAQDVLMVPEGAVQSQGRNSVVEVQKDDGSTEKVIVQTGLSDGTNIEITQGLEEGQTVVIPSRVATTSAQATQAAGFQQGGFGFPEGGGNFQPPSGGTR